MSEKKTIRDWLTDMLQFAPKNQTIYVSDAFFDELETDLRSICRYTHAPSEMKGGFKSPEIEYLGVKIRNTKHPECPRRRVITKEIEVWEA